MLAAPARTRVEHTGVPRVARPFPGGSPSRGATFGAMRPSAWAVFALCLLGSTCGTTTTAAEIGFDYVVSTVVLNTVVGSMNKISTVSRQIGAMCANALYFNASVVESATMKVVQAAAVTSGDNGAVLATYAGFVKSRAGNG